MLKLIIFYIQPSFHSRVLLAAKTCLHWHSGRHFRRLTVTFERSQKGENDRN